MTNERLTELIQEGGNDELLPLLWDKTCILIFKKCTQLWQFYGERLTLRGYSLDDFKQESYNALLSAVKSYKSDSEYKFTTYLNYGLKRVIRGLLSGSSDVLNRLDTQSLEQPLGEGKDGDPLLVENITPDDRAAAVYEDIERLDEYNVLYEAVDSLRPDLREVIREHYFERLTFKQIGELHGYSKQRATEKRDSALKVLRSGKLGAKLRSTYGEDYGTPSRYKHKSLASFRSSRTSEVEDYVFRRLAN